MTPGAFTPAARDTGGRTYTAEQIRFYGPDHLHYCWPEHEGGDLAKAQCMLEFTVENLESARADFEHTGTRPGWQREAAKLHKAAKRLLDAVTAELDR